MVIIQIYPKNLSVWANQDESNELFSLIVFRLKDIIKSALNLDKLGFRVLFYILFIF